MRLIFSTLLVLFFYSGPLAAQPMKITRIFDDFYIVTTFNTYQGSVVSSNSTYLITDKGVVLVDLPWNSSETLPLLDSIKRRHNKNVVMSISTHFHADRITGIDNLNALGITTWTTKETRKLSEPSGKDLAKRTFTGDTTFVTGKYRIQTFYPGPGHTNDNIVVWFPVHNILQGGCFVRSMDADDMGNTADGNVKEWPNSARKVIAKFPARKIVIPGHGDWSKPGSVEHTLELLKR